jgi:hypothetical protein
MSLLWVASIRGFILVDLSTAIIVGSLVGYILKSTSNVTNKYNKSVTVALVLIMVGMSFGLHYLLTMKLMSTTVGHANDLWWYVF